MARSGAYSASRTHSIICLYIYLCVSQLGMVCTSIRVADTDKDEGLLDAPPGSNQNRRSIEVRHTRLDLDGHSVCKSGEHKLKGYL